MIGTEFLDGQGLGNQLFCYVSTRCLALDKGYDFGFAGLERFKGKSFFASDFCTAFDKNNNYNTYSEREDRVLIANSVHDLTYGCYISGADKDLYNVQDNTLISGNLQDEEYFIKHKSEIKDWLRIKPEYDIKDYSAEDICIINLRGGEYKGSYALYLSKRYWNNAIRYMKSINPKMRFIVISDDATSAKGMFPKYPVYHFDAERDYACIKNAHYAIISNSSFAFFPIFTSETIKLAIAPKYWARHNVSDGYWASEQNIYNCLTYMDRKGKLFSAEQCRKELEEYKKRKYESFIRDAKDIKFRELKISYVKLKTKLWRINMRLFG